MIDPLPQVTWISQQAKKSRVGGWKLALYALVLLELCLPLLNGQVGDSLVLLLIIPILWVNIAVHELGHLLVAKLVGLRFIMLYVIPFQIARQPGGLRFSLVVRRQLPGFVSCLPADDRNLRANLAVYDLGGIAANLFLAGAVAAIASLHGYGDLTFLTYLLPMHSYPVTPSFFDYVVPTTEFMALTLAVLNLLPFKTNGISSDGGHLLQVLRGGPGFDLEYVRWLLHSEDIVLERKPREWNPELMKLALGLKWQEGNPLWHEVYCWALDRGDIALARATLEAAFREYERTRRPVPEHLLFEMAYFEARYLGDVTGARQRLLTTRPRRGFHCFHLRAEAAVLLAERQWQVAAERAREALWMVEREALTAGRTAQAVEWLHELVGEATAQAQLNTG